VLSLLSKLSIGVIIDAANGVEEGRILPCQIINPTAQTFCAH
jgi:hypothetical protein